jgi:hypothetical protein
MPNIDFCMEWKSFNTYGDAPSDAFETFCNHLFRNYIYRNHPEVEKFRVVNGKGGDGGVEAYALLTGGNISAVQSKWFRDDFGKIQIKQIRDSVRTAMTVRPGITEYVVCIPRTLTSIRVTGSSVDGEVQLTRSSGDQILDDLDAELKIEFPNLEIRWWVDEAIEVELTHEDNDGLHKFWFSREVISMNYLQIQFERQKAGWLFERYVPLLHAQGFISQDIADLTYSKSFRTRFLASARRYKSTLSKAVIGIDKVLKVAFDIKTYDTGSFREPFLTRDIFNDKLIVCRSEIVERVASLQKLIQVVEEAVLPKEIPSLALTTLDDAIAVCEAIDFVRQGKMNIHFLNSALNNLRHADFELDYERLKLAICYKGLLILCGPGTGKTHGLTFEVEQHLNNQAPALIVQALGTPSDSWPEILGAGLQLNGWSIDEILTAMECLATRCERRRVNTGVAQGEELHQEPTPVLIVVDGLEEDVVNWAKWNKRIRESILLASKYPRVKFLYSARPYFFKTEELPASLPIKVQVLPPEGDVPLQKLALQYFKPSNYNITLTSPSLIRGIDSAFALRLFCDEYRGRTLSEADHIKTAGRDLLALKVKKMESEFAAILGRPVGDARTPVSEAIIELANQFIDKVEIENNVLVAAMQRAFTYMSVPDIDRLLDYLSRNGILVKNVIYSDNDGIPIPRTEYFVTYRSIVEIVLATRTVNAIITEKLEVIPTVLFERLRLGTPGTDQKLPNEQIIQIIVNTMFHEHGRLIGDNDYLSKGFNAHFVLKLRREALRKAPKALAAKYKPVIDSQFWHSHDQRYHLLQQLILRGSREVENNFGARYLHDILIAFPNAYERDKIWLGQDMYGYPKNISVNSKLEDIIEFDNKDFYLSLYALHDETPLVYAWCLSSLNQRFRDRIRSSLTRWALVQPVEFVLLLGLIFPCKDPQIQEDLAAISLALAARLKDEQAIARLAEWALKHIFSDLRSHRNVIVRQGFRAIVERAHQFQLISDEQLEKCRPRRQENIELLPLELVSDGSKDEKFKPIRGDLEWYVIDKATHGFLKVPDNIGGKLKSHDGPEAEKLLDMYAERYGVRMFVSEWQMAAADAYIKSLGFSDTECSYGSQETHGEKGNFFTYPEKYTWLAVHYLMGYLSDYLPFDDDQTSVQINDYSKLINLPNPADELGSVEGYAETFDELVLPEPMFAVSDAAADKLIETEVYREPEIDFSKWLYFNESDFYLATSDQQLITLYLKTNSHDRTGLVYGRKIIVGCLIPRGKAPAILKTLRNEDYDLHFVGHIDRLHALPDTDIYSNPSDLVWMNWIEEKEKGEKIYLGEEELEMPFTVTEVTRTGVNGEQYMKIPSKRIRNLVGAVEMQGSFLLDKHEAIAAFLHKISLGPLDNQEIVFVNRAVLKKALDDNGLELVWFVDYLKVTEGAKSGSNEVPHFQKSRKYFVYEEQGTLQLYKFWDERFSNRRDRYDPQRIAALNQEIKKYPEFSENDIIQIEQLIIAGGEVDPKTLPARLKDAQSIAVIRDEETIVAVAAIKKPLVRYRNGVFTKATVTTLAKEYPLELGYVSTKPRYQGFKLASRLCSQLVEQFGETPLFSTTRTSNLPMMFVLSKLGFAINGKEFENKGGTGTLFLHLRRPAGTAEESTNSLQFTIENE